MSKPSKYLLVEGDGDRSFFEAFCRQTGIANVQVAPPKTMAAAADGKSNAISLLPKLIEQMGQGMITHLGLVVDADQVKSGGLGFKNTWLQVSNLLAAQAYKIPSQPKKSSTGFLFEHSDGLPAIGVWIMPDNFGDGLLEDFIKQSLSQAELPLFQIAEQAVAGLKQPKFALHHKSKAEIATYLAWQKMPGQGMQSTIGGQLLNFEKGLAQQFQDWLRKVFN